MHRETEIRQAGRSLDRGPGITRLDDGGESYAATLGVCVEYVPAWPFVGYRSVSATGSHLGTEALVPEVQELRDRMNGTGPHRGEPRDGGLLPEFRALADRLRSEERGRGLDLLAAELGRRGIAFERTGSTLTASGERREDEHRRTALNRRAAALHVAFPEPIVDWRDRTTRVAVVERVLARLAEAAGTDVEGFVAAEAERVLDARERAFAADGTVRAAAVSCRRRPLGGLVPARAEGDEASSLPPLG